MSNSLRLCQLFFAASTLGEPSSQSTLGWTNMAGWNIPIVNRKCIFKWSIFHCHVSLPEGTWEMPLLYPFFLRWAKNATVDGSEVLHQLRLVMLKVLHSSTNKKLEKWQSLIWRPETIKNWNTLPETNIAPENWWLEDQFPLGMTFREGTSLLFFLQRLGLSTLQLTACESKCDFKTCAPLCCSPPKKNLKSLHQSPLPKNRTHGLNNSCYCWWFSNLAITPGNIKEPCKFSGINLPISTGDGGMSEPSTVSSKRMSFSHTWFMQSWGWNCLTPLDAVSTMWHDQTFTKFPNSLRAQRGSDNLGKQWEINSVQHSSWQKNRMMWHCEIMLGFFTLKSMKWSAP